MTGTAVLVLRLLLIVALYGFLVALLVAVWSDVRRHSDSSRPHHVPPIMLSVTAGETRSQREFTTSDILIGRDSQCDLVLEDQTVSARHARLHFHHSQWWLEDLGSSNGTRLNELPLLQPAVLADADEFTCGGTNVVVGLQTGRRGRAVAPREEE